jgi:two-component system cell cycle response regulator
MEEKEKQIQALIVEDDPDQVMLYLTKFMIEGVTTIATDNEWDTMQYLLGGGFDIVLLDILLKGNENGMKILKTIKENPKTKDIPVVMFTNYTKKEVQDEAKKLGALDFIVKSETTPKMVAQRIKELVAEDKASKKI